MAVMKTPKKSAVIAAKIGPVHKNPFPGKPFTTKELVSKLKRLITETKIKAHDAAVQGDMQKMADLKKAAAEASRTLDLVVADKIDEIFIDDELQDAIRDLEQALSK